ncbi:MAG: nuclear transport factor 2 family protein [Burkholderiaceae bacterium]|jgi:uncharacterized protein (TIGR02246 family)|nr:nuclear transport factor 2 family protein [Burkholderiaceae bacterium]
MKIMNIARVVLVAAIAVLGAAPAWAQAKDPALEKLVANWTAAFDKGDAKALAGFYTENAVRSTREAGTVIGRTAIEKEFTANFAGPWKGARIAITVGKTYPAGAGVAVSEGTWEVTATGPDGKPMPLKGTYVNTIVKKAGAWVIASNATVPSASAPAK